MFNCDDLYDWGYDDGYYGRCSDPLFDWSRDYWIGYDDGYYGRCSDPLFDWSRDYWIGYDDGEADFEDDAFHYKMERDFSCLRSR